jgi:hypothetical protein
MVINPAHGPIRTTLNARQVSTDLKAGGSSPSERAQLNIVPVLAKSRQ